MKVEDVMTKDPITIGPKTPLKDVADILVAKGISGLPVVGVAGEPLGVISEADLLVKAAGPEPEARGPFGWRWLLHGVPNDESRPKLATRTAGEAMSSPAIRIRPDCSVAEAARLMIDKQVNRLPVVDDYGRVTGIVTRADLVRIYSRSDQQIRREIQQDVVAGLLWIDPARVSVVVIRGDATLSGQLDTKTDAELLPRLVERVPGVVSVTSELSWPEDEQQGSRLRRNRTQSGTAS
jgi:CBS domain-containing protein